MELQIQAVQESSVIETKGKRGFQGAVNEQYRLSEGLNCMVTEKCLLDVPFWLPVNCREDNLVERVRAKP